MKILIIANNIVGNYDGIGKHARIVGHEMEVLGYQVDYCTGSTWNKSKIGQIFSCQMSIAYLKAVKLILSNRIDYVDIEYPFKEYNPLVIFFHLLLWMVTRIKGTKISFSMHEYDRVKFLRRRIIDVFLLLSDLVFISEKKYFKELKQYAYKMRVRIIPSHGITYFPNLKDFSNPIHYCYFGLVNRAKAFDEMLEAWKKFNKEGKYFLEIVSISDLRNIDFSKYPNVTFHYNLNDTDSGKVLSKCEFALIPVLPNIGFNNSSFVSSIQCGCIPLGKFNADLTGLNFLVNMKSYEPEYFSNILESTQKLSQVELKQMMDNALKFGQNFSVKKTAIMMIDAFEEFYKK